MWTLCRVCMCVHVHPYRLGRVCICMHACGNMWEMGCSSFRFCCIFTVIMYSGAVTLNSLNNLLTISSFIHKTSPPHPPNFLFPI